MIRAMIIGLLVVLAGAMVVAHFTLVGDEPILFPDSWTPWIILAKGAFAMIGVILLLWHMNREWVRINELDWRLRYLTLLAYGVLQTGASTEQLTDQVELEWRHLGGFVVSVLFLVASAVSLRWSFKQNRTPIRRR